MWCVRLLSLRFIKKFLFLVCFVVFGCLFGTQQVYANNYELDEQGKIKGCATYLKKSGEWSKHYKVRGVIKTGGQLIVDTNDKRYNKHTKYYTIFWRNGGMTAIDIGVEGEPFVGERYLKDQRGKTWKLNKGWDFCGSYY